MSLEDLNSLSSEEQTRLEAAEQKALRILKMSVNDGPRSNRHMFFPLPWLRDLSWWGKGLLLILAVALRAWAWLSP